MHPTPLFQWTDRAAMLAFVGDVAFATVVGSLADRFVVAHAPVIVDGERLLMHLSRANPLARALPARGVVVISGPDTYVSPDWYAEPEQVPTWSYVSVEVEGQLVATDEAQLVDILRRQSAVYESRISGKRPWTLDKLSPSVLAAKLKGIVGVTMAIDAIRGTRKLSQNKSETDRAGVVAALTESADPMAREIAGLMRATRS